MADYTLPCRVLYENYYEIEGVRVPVQSWFTCLARVRGESYKDAMRNLIFAIDPDIKLEIIKKDSPYTIAPVEGIQNGNLNLRNEAKRLIQLGQEPKGDWEMVKIPIEIMDFI